MKLWTFLKESMLCHADKIAFEGGLTYAELIREAEKPRSFPRRYLRLCSGQTRRNQALELLGALAHGEIAVPTGADYGEARAERIRLAVSRYGSSVSPDTALILFTSGTTGEPKGVMLSHENVIENLLGIESYFAVEPGQKLLICRPLVHVSVLVGELLYGLYRGMEICFYEEPFQPRRLARAIDEGKIDAVCLTPSLMYHLAPVLSGKSLSSVVLSGERLSLRLAELLGEKYPGIGFYNVYGLTENAPRVSALTPEDFFRKPGSVGRPIRKTEIRIEDGELLVRSPSVMLGYLGREDLTREKVREGFLRTGDAASTDEEGFLYVLGRKDEMIIRGGVNIYPQEIENVVNRIAGVERCLVFGEEEIQCGQRVCLKYTGTLEPSALRKAFSGKLAPHLLPQKIERVETLPLTSGGKVIRG